MRSCKETHFSLLGCAVTLAGLWRRRGGPGDWRNKTVLAWATVADSDNITLEVIRSLVSSAGIGPAGPLGAVRGLWFVLMGSSTLAALLLTCSWYLDTQSSSFGSAEDRVHQVTPQKRTQKSKHFHQCLYYNNSGTSLPELRPLQCPQLQGRLHTCGSEHK